MSVGEFWKDCNYDEEGSLLYDQDSHRQAIVDWCDATGGTSTAFDFTTKVSHIRLAVPPVSLIIKAPRSYDLCLNTGRGSMV